MAQRNVHCEGWCFARAGGELAVVAGAVAFDFEVGCGRTAVLLLGLPNILSCAEASKVSVLLRDVGGSVARKGLWARCCHSAALVHHDMHDHIPCCRMHPVARLQPVKASLRLYAETGWSVLATVQLGRIDCFSRGVKRYQRQCKVANPPQQQLRPVRPDDGCVHHDGLCFGCGRVLPRIGPMRCRSQQSLLM